MVENPTFPAQAESKLSTFTSNLLLGTQTKLSISCPQLRNLLLGSETKLSRFTSNFLLSMQTKLSISCPQLSNLMLGTETKLTI